MFSEKRRLLRHISKTYSSTYVAATVSSSSFKQNLTGDESDRRQRRRDYNGRKKDYGDYEDSENEDDDNEDDEDASEDDELADGLREGL